jgi:hypothetical protein
MLRPWRLDDGDLALVREASADPLIPLITTVPAIWSAAEGEAFVRRQWSRARRRRPATPGLARLLDRRLRQGPGIEPWSTASLRTAEHAGFTREGLLRSWQRVGDQRRDMYMYALVAHP